MGHIEEEIERALIAQIRAELGAAGWSQIELAEKVGVSREAMSRYLRGTRTIPLDVYLRVSEAFNLSPRDLMQQAEERAQR